MLEELINERVSLTAWDWVGNTALHYAVIKGNSKAVKLLVKEKSD